MSKLYVIMYNNVRYVDKIRRVTLLSKKKKNTRTNLMSKTQTPTLEEYNL